MNVHYNLQIFFIYIFFDLYLICLLNNQMCVTAMKVYDPIHYEYFAPALTAKSIELWPSAPSTFCLSACPFVCLYARLSVCLSVALLVCEI